MSFWRYNIPFFVGIILLVVLLYVVPTECILWELQAKEIQVQELIPDKLQFTILSLQISDVPLMNII